MVGLETRTQFVKCEGSVGRNTGSEILASILNAPTDEVFLMVKHAIQEFRGLFAMQRGCCDNKFLGPVHITDCVSSGGKFATSHFEENFPIASTEVTTRTCTAFTFFRYVRVLLLLNQWYTPSLRLRLRNIAFSLLRAMSLVQLFFFCRVKGKCKVVPVL
jgi:hypothetical protein